MCVYYVCVQLVKMVGIVFFQLSLCESRLATIRTPDEITRTPRKLEDSSRWKGMSKFIGLCAFTVKQIKLVYACLSLLCMHACCILTGNEVRSWMLYYSLPVLSGVLPSIYFHHYSLLVASLHILSSDSIYPDDLETARDFLDRFYLQYGELYGIVTAAPLGSGWFFADWSRQTGC